MTSGIEHLSNWQLVAQPLLLADFGPTVVLSPHPDDESLGCGGTMAQLQQMGIPVQVLMISDGSKSHPNSKKYPADKLRALRESETLAALCELGMSPEQVTFMHLPDGDVPGSIESPGYHEAVAQLTTELNQLRPQTILMPWRRDPHRDHRATYQLLEGALSSLDRQPTILEYPIWLWELGTPDNAPYADEVRAVQVDITPMRDKKHRAIAAHASQVTQLIDDDPEAFWLRPDLLVYFEGNSELFFKRP